MQWLASAGGVGNTNVTAENWARHFKYRYVLDDIQAETGAVMRVLSMMPGGPLPLTQEKGRLSARYGSKLAPDSAHHVASFEVSLATATPMLRPQAMP